MLINIPYSKLCRLKYILTIKKKGGIKRDYFIGGNITLLTLYKLTQHL